MIPLFVEQGLNDDEIAAKMGWTVGTLRVRCSQLKISLRRSTIWKNGPHLFRTVAIPRSTFDQLQQRAVAMGTSAAELVADLLKEIVHDGLYDAVLDRDNNNNGSYNAVARHALTRLQTEAATLSGYQPANQARRDRTRAGIAASINTFS
jgi:hypothetical protein